MAGKNARDNVDLAAARLWRNRTAPRLTALREIKRALQQQDFWRAANRSTTSSAALQYQPNLMTNATNGFTCA
jgi:hypothetical protein